MVLKDDDFHTLLLGKVLLFVDVGFFVHKQIVVHIEVYY